MTGTAPLPYEKAAEHVEDMMGRGTPFAHVEDMIETAQAPRDDKAALWLLAWSLRGPALRTPRHAAGYGWSVGADGSEGW